jgi:hypothetical protein
MTARNRQPMRPPVTPAGFSFDAPILLYSGRDDYFYR